MRTLQLLRRLALPLAALVLLLLGACQEPPTGTGPTGNETVSGTLTDEQGNFVPGALVEAINTSNARLAIDTTDDYGMFALGNLPTNMSGVQLRVLHSDFKPFTSSMQGIVSMAGGPEGVLVNVLHTDSCCATLTVTVASANGGPLGNVEVRLRRGSQLVSNGRTDSAGHVTFSNVCEGEFNLRMSREGYQVVERGGIHVNDCQSTTLDFSMQAAQGNEHHDDSCCNGKLRIVPLDSATGAVITGANVRITKVGGNTRTLISNGDGAIFRELCSGTYNVRIAKEGNPRYRVVEFQITLGCNDSVRTDRRLGRITEGNNNGDTCCNGRVDIIPRDSATNAVLNGASVRIRKGSTEIGTKTTANGHTVFEGLCTGEYHVVITKDGYHSIEFNFTLTCNQHVELPRTMAHENADSCCSGSISVVVRDSTTNSVIANATVRLWKNGVNVQTKTTNSNGVANFENLCTGSYGFDLVREGYHSREFNVTITCNQHLEVTKKLLHTEGGDTTCCTGRLQVRVKDSTVAEGGWLTGVTVTIKKGNDVVATGTTNADGYYVREGLCGNATYTVTFSKDSFHSKTVSFTYTTCRNIEETIRIVPE